MGLSIEYYVLLTLILKLCEFIGWKIYYYWKICTTYQAGYLYIIDKKIWRLNKIGWLSTEFQLGNIIEYVPNKMLYRTYFIEKKNNLLLSA